MFQNRQKDIRTLNNTARDIHTDLDGLRCRRALKTSETGAKDRSLEDNKREGKTPGQGLV
jgi:hypothetical protein